MVIIFFNFNSILIQNEMDFFILKYNVTEYIVFVTFVVSKENCNENRYESGMYFILHFLCIIAFYVMILFNDFGT